MATATKICKVCGKEYPYCKTEYKPGVFRYQDVACCPEHGSIYLAEVERARNGSKTTTDEVENCLTLLVEDDEDEGALIIHSDDEDE